MHLLISTYTVLNFSYVLFIYNNYIITIIVKYISTNTTTNDKFFINSSILF